MPLTLEDKVRLLSMVDVFESLVREELEEVARRACDTHLERGDVLCEPQEEGAEELYVLKEGRVQLFVKIPDGGEVTLSVVEEGSIFGELALGGSVRTPSATARTPLRASPATKILCPKPPRSRRVPDDDRVWAVPWAASAGA